MREVLLCAKIRLSVWHTVLDFDLRGCPCVAAMLHGTLAVVPGQMSSFFYGGSIRSTQHRNSSNLGPKTRFSCVRGRTLTVRGSKPFAEGFAEAHERVRKPLRSLRSPFAEADAKIQPKNLRRSTRGRRKQKRLQALLAEGSRKGFAEGVVSAMKLYKNKNHRSDGRLLLQCDS